MIYDGNYTDDEFPAHLGWGHSTWQEGARIAQVAGVKRLVIFHHDPDHDDAVLDRIAAETQQVFSNTIIAAEGMILRV